MIAYVLEYDWVLTSAGWTLRSGNHRVSLENFQFAQTDARFINVNLTSTSFQTMKRYLDQNGLKPRVFNVLPGENWDNAYCVLRFEPDQERAAVLAQLFCS